MGGNVFKNYDQGTSDIARENIDCTVAEYFGELSKLFPSKRDIFNFDHFRFTGSVGKKATSGDIDLAIDISSLVDKDFSDQSISQWGIDPNVVRDQFDTFKKRARTATDQEIILRAFLFVIAGTINDKSDLIICEPKKITAGNMFAMFPQFDCQGVQLSTNVQLDWQVGNVDWLEFSYYSDQYDSPGIKGLHRTQLMLSMFLIANYTFNHIRGVVDRETREVITNDPIEAIELLNQYYDIELDLDTVNNYHSLAAVVDTLPQAQDIYKTFVKILDSTKGGDIPEELHDRWRAWHSELKLTGKYLPDDSPLLERTVMSFKQFISMIK